MVVFKSNISDRSIADRVQHKPTSSCADDAEVTGTGGNILIRLLGTTHESMNVSGLTALHIGRTLQRYPIPKTWTRGVKYPTNDHCNECCAMNAVGAGGHKKGQIDR